MRLRYGIQYMVWRVTMEKQIVALAIGISLIYFIDGLGEVILKKKDTEYKFYYVVCPLYITFVLAYLIVEYL